MARPKKPTDDLKNQRIPIMMTEAELSAVDDWSFENRIRSRGEAIRRLCHVAIQTYELLPSLAADTATILVGLTDLHKIAALRDDDEYRARMRAAADAAFHLLDGATMLQTTLSEFGSSASFKDAKSAAVIAIEEYIALRNGPDLGPDDAD